jgi:phospholipid/cholesterol/gamma-HCH transport system substrate-binding protein
MNKETLHNIRLGIFVMAGILLLITGLYFIGSNTNMFSKTITLYVTFKNVSGLKAGNNIRYAGIDVGTVEDIVIVNDTTIRVKMSVKADLQKVIRKNSLATLGTDGLMGNKLINIDPVSSDGELVKEGDELASTPAINMEEMLRTLSVTNRNVLAISANLKTLTDNINNSRGTLYTVLMDTTIAPKIHHSLDNIATISDNIKLVSEDLNEIIAEVQQGKGTIGKLVSDTAMSSDLVKAIQEVKSAGERINSSAMDLKQVLEKVNEGKGTIGTLINDTASANSLKRSLLNVEEITIKFNEDLEALKHNFLFSRYFKNKEKEEKKKQGK